MLGISIVLSSVTATGHVVFTSGKDDTVFNGTEKIVLGIGIWTNNIPEYRFSRLL